MTSGTLAVAAIPSAGPAAPGGDHLAVAVGRAAGVVAPATPRPFDVAKLAAVPLALAVHVHPRVGHAAGQVHAPVYARPRDLTSPEEGLHYLSDMATTRGQASPTSGR